MRIIISNNYGGTCDQEQTLISSRDVLATHIIQIHVSPHFEDLPRFTSTLLPALRQAVCDYSHNPTDKREL